MTRTLFLLLLVAAPAAAQRDARVPDPDPELERKTFVLPPGFEVNLFASDPLLAKPIQMNFDPAGRLWVATSQTYPQVKPGQSPDDKVLILEDTQGRGVADKTTVFARGLLIPTGVAPGDGGCYVAHGTELLHLSDPDPATGEARTKKVVLSGFGTEDTHHLLHTLKWGPDGGLYMNQSVYIHSHVETADGVKRLNAGGVWRFEPKAGWLEVFARGLWNPWGTAWDKWGRGFVTDGAGFNGINMLWRGAEYEAGYKVTRPLPGLNPGSPKLCGLTVLSGRHLPPEYDGSLVANDFRGHRVCRYTLTEDGAGFVSREQQELIKSDHPAFRPIDVCMGPDGAVYVADWYNPIIQHGEVDFRDPRRDVTHGRIWRITCKGRPLVERPKLVGASDDELTRLSLSAPEEWTREQARRVLIEAGRRLPDTAWLLDLDARLADPRDRANALRATSTMAAARFVAAPEPHVRREAVRALGRVGTAEAAVAAVAVLDQPMDRWLDYALWLTMRELAPAWLPEVRAGKLDFGGDPKKLLFALQAVGTADVAGPLRKLLDRGLPADRKREVLLALAKHGGPADLGLVVNSVAASPADATALLTAAVESVRVRKVGPPEGLRLTELLDKPNPGRAAAATLAGLWKLEACRSALEALGGARHADGIPPADRRAAIEAVAMLGGQRSIDYLAGYTGYTAPQYRAWAATALARLDLPRAAGMAGGLFNVLDADAIAEVVAAFSQRPGGAAALAQAVEAKYAGGNLLPASARAGLQAARTAGKAGEPLVATFTKLGQAATHKWDIRGDEAARFVSNLPSADPARGEAVYRRAELQCQKCHAIAGAGGLVGPELTSLGGSAQPDYILESLLVPHAKVKEGYNAVTVSTADGRQVTGVKVRQTDAELVLRDADGKLVTVPTADVEKSADAPSLMPAGLVDVLDYRDLLDLVRFLSELGKGAYAAKPGVVVRTWEAVEAKPVFPLLGRRGFGVVANEPGLPWKPVYARVNGDLPLDELPRFWLNKDFPLAAARFAVERNTAGPTTLRFADPAGLQLWVDGVPHAAAEAVRLDLSAGPHVVTVGVEVGKRSAPLRVAVE